MARLAVLAILFVVVAATTITSAHGGRALKTAGALAPTVLEVAEPPSSMVEDIAALLRLFPTTDEAAAAADGPVASYYERTDYDYKINFVLLISRQGKVRLTKWYSPYTQKERTKVIRELSGLILTRGPKLCNFVEWRGYKVVYRRYASLYFCMCIDADDNELEVLEIIHHFVEILDRYFGSVCELDLIFNFHKAYYVLDEILISGELQESSKKNVARLIAAQDSLVEAAKEEAGSISNIIAQATK
ncbi:hypothetical protein ZWY2020_017912 [Hordeum vulgare]|nr:hypothetical protein ZWY2020_017912 [Hordeum vulgare]